jgi:class 3 adenylate cyclase
VPTIAEWLGSIGLAEYEQRFAENDVDISVLPHLADQDLKELGVSLGHRRKMLAAIAQLAGAATSPALPQPAQGPEPKRQDTAERRQLTVMFCDLVGSTALSTRLDPEDLRAIINAYHGCATELVERNGGFVAKYMGDGILAYFGYPRASEHDAEQAVRAGLALVEAVPKLATAAGTPLQVRIGVATGLVVVGDLIGKGAAQEQAVVGETPNLAARLQALAEPGAMVISPSTRRLTGGLFEYRDLGTVKLKGFGDDVQAWQVLGVGAAESRFEALRATTTPLVGRDEEIELLVRRWEQVKAGEGHVLLISGEPGIGKSRIAQSFVDRISREPHTRLRYFCSPHHQDSALHPCIAQLQRASGFHRDDTVTERLSKLETLLAQGTDDFSEVVPLLADLLSIPTGARYPLVNLAPQKRKEKTLHALLAQVEGLASRQPVLMVFEDVHWSDPTTREILDLLMDRVLALRVLVIITFRPEFVPPWTGRPQVTTLNLNRLPPRRCAEMIAQVVGGKALPREIADQIVDRTDGVPLFVEELTKTVLESGIVIDAGDRYAVAGPVAPLAIPNSLHASLLARLDRLAPTREVAQIGAALGRSFSHELISAVALMPNRQLEDALEQLVGADLIFRRGAPPDAEYTFKHALVQDAAYSTLLRSRRQQLHARIAATLESAFPDLAATQPALLAHHFAEAAITAKAVDYRLRAAHQYVDRSAMMEAETHVRKGLDQLSNLPEDAARQQMELDLQSTLGLVLIATKGYTPEVGDTFVRARQLCEQLDRPVHLTVVLVGQSAYHCMRGELHLACEESKLILDIGERYKDNDIAFFGYAYSAMNWFHIAEFTSSLTYARKALATYNPTNPLLSAATALVDSHSLAEMFIFRSLTYLGYLDQARASRVEAMTRARQRDHTHTLCMLTANSLLCEQHLLSDPATLLSQGHELVAFSLEQGFPYWALAGALIQGNSLSALGRSTEAVLTLEGVVAQYRSVAVSLLPLFLTALAEALLRANREEEGLSLLDEAHRQIEATDERWTEAEMYRIRAESLIATGDLTSAEQSFQHALAVARRQSAKLWEVRAATSLARLWRDQGRRTEAHDLLAPVYGWFTEGFDIPVLKEAKSLLDELVAVAP